MDQARDVNGAIKAGWATMTYGTLVGQFPKTHKYLFGNPTLVRIVDSIWEKNPMNMIQQVCMFSTDLYLIYHLLNRIDCMVCNEEVRPREANGYAR